MLRSRILKTLCMGLTAVMFICLFDNSAAMAAPDETYDILDEEIAGEVEILCEEDIDSSAETVVEEEIDEEYFKFVGRLYAIVTRQSYADPDEKYELAKSLKGGISAAYDVLYHFYFSEEYKELAVSDDVFVEDLYRGCYARESDESGKEYYLSMLESGYSRYMVFREFLGSNEFVQMCASYNIRIKQILLENYVDHLDGMTCICDDYYDLDSEGNLGWCYVDAAKHVRCINEFYYTSPTKYYIIADIDNCYIMIFKGSAGDWKLYKIYPMSCGKPGHETPRGHYKVTGYLSYFYSHGSLCYYATQWNGPYYLHSVTYNYNGTLQNGTLGAHISAGCIRLRKDVAEWIYWNIPYDTPVWTI